jgi:Fe-S-cluster containining protein
MSKLFKCDISKCHAKCCINVPIPSNYLRIYRKKIVNPILRVSSAGLNGSNMIYSSYEDKLVYPITNTNLELNKCPFLTKSNKCNIYDIRPKLCRDYGTSKYKFLQCEFMLGRLNIDESIASVLEYIRDNDEINKGIK